MQNVKNPANLKILALNKVEYMFKLGQNGVCNKCSKEFDVTICYVSIINSYMCPDCMRTFVRNFTTNDRTTELTNYKEILSKL